MSIFIIALVGLWVLAAVVLSSQMARVWRLDFATVGAMTVSQVCSASRRGAIITFTAFVTLSWPVWLEINCQDRAVFRDGKLVRIFDSGAVMLQHTWNDASVGADVVLLSSGVVDVGTAVEMQCPSSDGQTNGVLIVMIDGKNDRDDIAKRLEYCLKSGVREDAEYKGYSPSIVKRVVRESSQWDSLCRTAKKLPIEENGDGTTRLKAKQEVLEIAEKISGDLWSRLGIRIVDVDFR